MRSLDIHPRLIRFFLLILTLNLVISIATQYEKTNVTGMMWFLNLTFPLWASIIGAFPIGVIIFLIPQGKFTAQQRLLRSHIFGMMITSFIIFVMYLYQLMLTQAIQ